LMLHHATDVGSIGDSRKLLPATANAHANLRSMTSSSSPAHSWAKRPAHVHVLLLCALTAATLLLPLAAAALPFQQQAVDWTLVPLEPEAAANLSTSCICALLNGTCTPGCCCDTACPTELIAGFESAGKCMPEGPPPQQLPYCVPAEPFAKVQTSGDAAAAGADLSCILCIPAINLCHSSSCQTCQHASIGSSHVSTSTNKHHTQVVRPTVFKHPASPACQHVCRSTCQQGTTTACSSVQQMVTSSAKCCV
jgi:hypothetical protein